MVIHAWYPYINKTVFWLPMDTEELYNQNLKEKYDLLKKFDWIDRRIEYKFNSHGFRSEEFTTDADCMIALGCSHTAGVGLPVENTWPYYVSQALGLKLYNLSVGGGSNDLAFRISYNYLEKLKPKVVCLLSPEPARIEVRKLNDVISIMLHNGEREVGNYYKFFLSNEENSLLNQQKNILGIESLCNRLKIKFACITKISDIPDNQRDLARDLMHNGPKTNYHWAQSFLNKLNGGC